MAIETKYAVADRPYIMIDVEPWLMEAWPVEVKKIARFTVHEKTQTDGASIPRCLWRLCGHPLEVPRVYAALAHDWLYGGGVPEMTRKDADRCYYKLLRHFGIGRVKAKTEYYALRVFGESHWHD